MGEKPLQQNSEKVTALMAKDFAESEFEKYRIVQDRLFESDFDKKVKRLKGKQDKLEDTTIRKIFTYKSKNIATFNDSIPVLSYIWIKYIRYDT